MAPLEDAATRDLIVIGASAGGVEAMIKLVSRLPADLPAAVCVVVHLSPNSASVLPRILSRSGELSVVHPTDGGELCPGCVYVAPPDRHLLVEDGRIRLSAGPQENRHRPAVDPLFRTAARAYGSRAIGVVLTGSGDDGSAGLKEIKRRGGTAVVQDPEEAFSPGMPRNAAEHVAVDYCLPLREIAPLLARLCSERSAGAQDPSGVGGERMSTPEKPGRPLERLSLGQEHALTLPEAPQMPGPPVGFACPHCNGHLWEVEDEGLLRFRCRVGHAYTAESLLDGQLEKLDSTLWMALNAFEENAALCHRMADRARSRGHDLTERRLRERARDTEKHALLLRNWLTAGLNAPPEPEKDAADTVMSRLHVA